MYGVYTTLELTIGATQVAYGASFANAPEPGETA